MERYKNVPDELKMLKHWVCYKLVPKEDGRVSKEPRDPRSGKGAKSNDPNSWLDFDSALKGMNKWGLDGLSFALGNGFVGIDLDHVIENGNFTNTAAREIFNSVNSYSELSPSGTGVHIICKAPPIPDGGGTRAELPGQAHPGTTDPTKKQQLEMYSQGRFLTMTGKVISGRKEVKDCSLEFSAVHERFIGIKTKKVADPEALANAVKVTASDAEIIEKIMASDKGHLFSQLWNGDWGSAGYPSQSEADMALINMLTYWCNGDRDRIDGLFRQSGLMRDKWNRRQSGSTYGALTIDQALANFTPYTGPSGRDIVKAIETIADNSMPSENNPHPDNVFKYLKDSFQKDIVSFMAAKHRKTGFENLDKESTGLYPGLYVIGAISSLGKTTFCSQMADNLAEAGESVLYFSVEQSRMEMISKSIARRTAKNSLYNQKTGLYNDISHISDKAVSAINIRKGNITNEVKVSIQEYANIAKNIDLVECGFGVTLEYIRDYVVKYIEATRTRPVIFIDYLQVLRTNDQKLSKQERMDVIVTGLKKLQADHNLVIIVISSFNRQNYLSPVDFESFKESGKRICHAA